jgi:O-antigen/teichoic acid export membrane protein
MSKSFFHSVSYVFGGTFLAQLIPLAGTLALARIFPPSDFGIYSVWLGVVLFLSVVLTGRFEMSLAVEHDGDPRRLAATVTLFTIALGSAIAGCLLWLSMHLQIASLSRLPLILILIAIPTSALVAGINTFQNWAAADGRYTHLSAVRLVQATLTVVLQISFGLLKSDAISLGSGYLTGVLGTLFFSMVLMPIRPADITQGRRQLFDFWKSQRRFPAYSLPADSLSAATAQLPVIVVASRFGEDAAGLVAMALRTVGAPMSILSASVLDVFKRHASAAFRERGECRSEYLHAFRILLTIAIPSAGATMFLAKPLFDLFFDEKWLGAAAVCVWLLPRFAAGFVASPLSYMVYIVGKQHLDFVWQLALVSVTLSSLFLLERMQPALLVYSSCYGILYIVYLYMSYKFSCGSEK